MPTTMEADNRLKAVRVSGNGYSASLEQVTESVSFSMAYDKITAMAFSFVDDINLSLFRSKLFDQGSTIAYGEWGMTVTGVDLDSGDVGPTLAVEALSTFVYKWQDQFGAKTWSNVDVTQWFKDMCKTVGATAVIQPGLGRKTIVRESSVDNGFQNTWEVMATVKRENGLWMFERGRKFIVGRPSWIIQQAQEFQHWPIYWNDWYDYTAGLTGLPRFSGRNGKKQEQTLSFSLASPDADTIRPGDRVTLTGRAVGVMSGDWLVSEVGFAMDNTTPVTVTCLRPVDPPKEDSTTISGLGAGGAGGGWMEGADFDVRHLGTYSFNAPSASGGGTISLSNLPGSVAGFSGSQLTNAAHIIRASQSLGLPKKAAQIAVMTAIGESTLRILNYGDAAGPDSRGLFQQRSVGWGTYACRMDAFCSARSFLQALVKVPNWSTLPPTLAAHYTQRNADPNHYTRFWSSAVKIVDSILATATTSGGVSTGGSVPASLSSAVDRYTNSVRGRAIDFDGAFGAQCVDLTMHYTVAMGGPRIYGNGRDWWNTGRASGFYVGVSRSSAARKGDIATWGAAGYGGGWGHVAIVLQDNGSTLRVLTQNPGPPQIMNLNKNGLDGYLRPKKWR